MKGFIKFNLKDKDRILWDDTVNEKEIVYLSLYNSLDNIICFNINNFTKLKELYLGNNPIKFLNIEPYSLPELEILHIENTKLDFSKLNFVLPSLKVLYADNINSYTFPNLIELNIQYSTQQKINIEKLPLLEIINIDNNNQLRSLNIENLPSLKTINIKNNNTLNIFNINNLQHLESIVLKIPRLLINLKKMYLSLTKLSNLKTLIIKNDYYKLNLNLNINDSLYNLKELYIKGYSIDILDPALFINIKKFNLENVYFNKSKLVTTRRRIYLLSENIKYEKCIRCNKNTNNINKLNIRKSRYLNNIIVYSCCC